MAPWPFSLACHPVFPVLMRESIGSLRRCLAQRWLCAPALHLTARLRQHPGVERCVAQACPAWALRALGATVGACPEATFLGLRQASGQAQLLQVCLQSCTVHSSVPR